MPEPIPSPDADVRMRGFKRRVTVETALAWLDVRLQPLEAETVPLQAAAARVLASAAISSVDVPGFDRAMMDGFAVRADRTEGATPYNRLELQIIGDAYPGRPFPGEVGADQAVRIMTGAPLPSGADAVLPAELAEVEAPRVWALGDVSPGKHIGRRGEDIAAGSELLSAGRRLRPQDLGVLSSIGWNSAPVIRRPRINLLITGSELLPAGTKPHEYHIADANGPMLSALVARDGGVVAWQGLVTDDRQAILEALQAEADVVIVSGGSSVGQEDYVPMLLAELGELAIHGIAMRPSSPTGLGMIGNRLVFLLPGNPVSCLCAYDFFAGRAIRRLGGRSSDWPYRSLRMPLARKLCSVIGRNDYARVRVVDHQVEPLAIGGASVLTSTTRADGFVIVPADSEGYPAGAEVEVFLYD